MEKQKRKLGLVPKLIIGIILGILLGQPFVPEVIARLVVTASSLFSLFLKFVIPLMILAYVTMGIADLSQGAGKLLLVTAGLAYASTLIAGSCSYLVSSTLFPSFMSADALEQIAETAGNSLSPYLTIAINPILDTLAAVLLAFILGLCMSSMRGKQIGNSLGCTVILVINHAALIESIKSIFIGAFQPQALAGGIAGVTVKEAMRYGVARGLFSNEAGMGSTPHAHALAKVKKPQDQGIIAMVGVFIDTFIILTLTALVILTSGALSTGATGSVLAQTAFNQAFGQFGSVFIAICMLFFAFSTIIGWYFFGEVNVKALFGKKAVKIYAALVVVCVILGSSLKVDLVWNLSDLFNGLMVFPNLIALIALSGVVAKMSHEDH